MPFSYPEIRTFRGLYLQANSFTVPDGAFEILENCTIQSDDVVKKRRGFYEYYNPSGDTVYNLFVFQDKLIGVFNNKLVYFTDTGSSPNLTGSRTTLTGATVTVSSTSRAVESNKNLYVTTDEGVLKLESYNGTVWKTGVPEGLDLRGRLISSGTAIANNKLVGWRVVFGRRDANDNLLLGAPSEVYTLTNTTGGVCNARLESSIPSEITSANDGYFYQIYRSSQVASTASAIFSDFRLCYEQALTSSEISAGRFVFLDDVDDVLLGDELYTNQNSQEGEAQANYRPPKCDDIAFFKGFVMYGNCETRHVLDFAAFDPSVLASLDFIEVKVDSTTRRYVARTGQGNATTLGAVASAAGNLEVTYASHGLQNGDSVYIDNVVGGTLAAGTYYVVSRAANTFQIATSIGGSSVAHAGETALDFQGIRTLETAVIGASWVRASNVVTVTSASHGLAIGMVVYITNAAGGTLASGLYTITAADTNTFSFASAGSDDASGNTCDFQGHQPQFQLDNSSSVSIQLSSTARGLVKAINRDTSSLVYASYNSGIADVPGQIRLAGKGFTGAIYVRGNDSTTGTAFSPVLPSSFSSGTQVYSRNDDLPSTVMVSKYGEPEAVPLVNQFPIGASNKDLLRVLPLRDSVILLKEDGVYRLSGDDVDNFLITPLDTTVQIVAPNSAVILNNEVFCLTNQGVCKITDSSVQIMSRKIEDVIQPILGESTIAANTAAFAYESDRLYGLSTMLPNGTTNEVVNVYNIVNDSWSTWDIPFTQACIGPGDILYLIDNDNTIQRERKNQTAVDYCGQNYSVTIDSVTSTTVVRLTVSGSGVPEQYDAVFFEDIFNRIELVSLVSGTTYDVTFERAHNFEASDAGILYKQIEARFKFAPFHAGMVGRMKQFTQVQLHFRNNTCTQLDITFTGMTFGSSEDVSWESPLVSLGWALFPWGFEPFGQSDSTNLNRRTTPSAPCRILVPRYQQRNTFIQMECVHRKAGEPILLQAQSWVVRAYNERVTT